MVDALDQIAILHNVAQAGHGEIVGAQVKGANVRIEQVKRAIVPHLRYSVPTIDQQLPRLQPGAFQQCFHYRRHVVT